MSVCVYVFVGLRIFVCFLWDCAAPRDAFEGTRAFVSTGVWFCMDLMFLRLMMVLLLLLLSCGPVRVVGLFCGVGPIFVDRREAFAHCWHGLKTILFIILDRRETLEAF